MTESVREPLVVDHDTDGRGKEAPVEMSIDVPPRAASKGWGDMSWLNDR